MGRSLAAVCVREAREHVARGTFSPRTEVIVWDWGQKTRDADAAAAAAKAPGAFLRNALGGSRARSRSRRSKDDDESCDISSALTSMAGSHISFCVRNDATEPWASIGIRVDSKGEVLLQSPDPTPDPFRKHFFPRFRLAAWTTLPQANADTLNKLLDPNRPGAFEHRFWIKPCLPRQQLQTVEAFLGRICPKGATCRVAETQGLCEVLIRSFEANTFVSQKSESCEKLGRDECGQHDDCFLRSAPMGYLCASKPSSFNEILHAIYDQMRTFTERPRKKLLLREASPRRSLDDVEKPMR